MATMTSERVLHGRYRLLSQIGEGGMGSVWLAEDQLLKRTVALKELLQHLGTNDLDERRTRALAEARAMARVNHPAIVPIHDVFLVGEDPWIVMEYIKGRSLQDIIRDHPLDDRAIAEIGLPVLHGLCATHSADVVHRDVKPTNILVADDKSVFLVDFGIAKIAGDIQLTGNGRMVGTTEFMAPERILGRTARPTSDMWSLGVTLFCALEGYSPFLRRRDGGQEAIIWAILNDDPPRPKRQGRLAEVVLQLLHKDPTQRADAAQLAEVLQAIHDGQATSTQKSRQSTTKQAPRSAPRQRGAALAGAQLQEAREAVKRASPDAGAAMLLAMSDENAAQILTGLRAREAGALIQAIAATQIQTAGAILKILSSSGAGHAVDYVSPPVAASILAAMPVREAVRILSRTDSRTAAEVIMELPGGVSVHLIKAMPRRQAATALAYVRPATVAALFRASDDLKGKLLEQLSPAFRVQVMRHL